MRKALSKKAIVCSITATLCAAHSSLSTAALSNEELEALVVEQSQRIAELEAGLDATAEELDSFSTLTQWASKTSIGGYGEHHYNNFQGSSSGDDQIDAHRFVVFIGYQYSDTLRFFSEIELEHGVAGEDQPGEVELEQAFIEWDYADKHSAQFGLYLLPVGILNETHEPDTFYGVERNRVEQEVIPTTWWETGIMLTGAVTENVSYNFAVHSGLEVPTTGDSSRRIRSGRQKSAEAVADDFAVTGRIKYVQEGVELAATLQFQEDITQGGIPGETQSATLFEAHTVIEKGDFGFRALYAQWDIDSDFYDAVNIDSLSGFYVEPSYKLTEKLGVFARYSEWERADDIADAFTANSSEPDFAAVDVGFNYWLAPTVVLKADYSDVSSDFGNDSFNLGVGWSY